MAASKIGSLRQYLSLARLQCTSHTKTNLLRSVTQRVSASGYATDASETPQGEHIKKILAARFPLAQSIEVVDISGGCGAMFQVSVESVEFKGLSLVKQHRLINDALKDEIKQMHGLQIHTGIPSSSGK